MTMTPTLHRYRPLAAVGLVTALLVYVGCSSSKPEPAGAPARPAVDRTPAAPAGKADKPKAAPGTTKTLFANWPTPAGALVISGEQLGYLEPCGCTQGQLGGLLRRYDFVERLREQRKWPLALVDLGSLIKDPAAARGGPEQTKLKFNTALKALALLKYDALALSPEDLKVGSDEAVSQFVNLPPEGPKVVAANASAAIPDAKIVPSVRTQAGPVKIGVTAVVDPEAVKGLKDPALADLIEVKPIDQTLPGVLADLEKDTQMQVLLVQAAPESARKLAEKYPGFDIVVGTSASDDPPSDAEPLNGGKTLLVTVGHKGKFVGVVGLFQDQGTEKGPSYRYQRVMLDPEYDGRKSPMKVLVEDEFRGHLKQQGVVEHFPRHDFVTGAGGFAGATFVGVEKCKTCHPNTVEKWESTKHAQGFESLVHDPKPDTMFDAECVACHTTGFEYTSGWKSPTETPFLKGNQCENCHGPASKHIANPRDAQVRAAMHLTVEMADKNRLCLPCHDEDNSPKFEFAKYWDEIEHTGLDTPKKNLEKWEKESAGKPR
jgi:hypothetical protein